MRCAGHVDKQLNFYPRPPRGGRQALVILDFAKVQFLSTPSARRATRPSWSAAPAHQFLSTPSARRATRAAIKGVVLPVISIHALREEGDHWPSKTRASMRLFLSTPSARRATLVALYLLPSVPNFYPRPPRGGRQQKQRQNLYFQTNCTTFCTNLEEP